MMPMVRFVNHFLLLSTLVWTLCGSTVWAAPQTQEVPGSPLLDAATKSTAEPAQIDSLIIDQPKEQDWNELRSYSKSYRWFGIYGEAYQGTSAEAEEAKTIGILGLEYSHRYLIDMYWQASLAFTDIDGIFFRFHHKELIRDFSWGRSFIRYGLQHTTNPKQQIGSFLNLNNLYANIGIGAQNAFGLPEEYRLQFDTYAGLKGLGFALSLAYDFSI